MTNRRTEYRVRDAVLSFLLRKRNRQRNQERDGGIFKWLVKGSTQHLPSSFLETNRSWRWICGWLAGLRTDSGRKPTNSSMCRDGYPANFTCKLKLTNNFSAHTPRYKIILPIYYRRYSYLPSYSMPPSCKAAPYISEHREESAKYCHI